MRRNEKLREPARGGKRNETFRPGRSRARLVACLVTGLASVMAVVAAHDAWSAIGKPWLGVGLLPQGLVLPVSTRDHVAAVGFQDRIVSVDARPVSGAREIEERLAAMRPGAPLTLGVERPSGVIESVSAWVHTFDPADYWQIFGPLLVGGVLGLVLGLVPLLSRPESPIARAWFAFNFGVACNFGILSLDWALVHRFAPWGVLFGALGAGGLLHLGMALPRPLPIHARWPRATVAAAYAIGAIAFVGWFAASFVSVAAVRKADFLEGAAMTAGALLLFANTVRVAFGDGTALARRQARLLLFCLLMLVPGWVLLLASLAWSAQLHLPPILHLLPLWACGLAIAWGMVRENLFELDAVARRAVTWALMLLGSMLLGGGTALALRAFVAPGSAWMAGGAVALLLALATGLPALREPIEGAIAQRLFPGHERARRAVHGASRELARLREPSELASIVRETVAAAVGGASARLFAGEPDGPLAEIAPSGPAPPGTAEAARETSGPVVPTSALHAFARSGGTLALDLDRDAARGLASEMEARGARVAVALPPGSGATGLLLVGRRADERLYTSDDAILLETLAGQLAVALENARAWTVVRSLERKLAEENHYLRQELAAEQSEGEIVGRSAAIRAVLAQIERVAPTDATVLVIGETGTGKELVVRSLHERSSRRAGILVKVACAALPEALLESELFGHERGAFTGATAAKPGRLEIADGGTLFLDDVDTLSLPVQAKLLRAIEVGETQRLGSNTVRKVSARVIAATNRDLLAEVRAGRFREDLYYRLHVVPIHLPPLRERREDVPLLVEHLVAREGPRFGREVREVSAAAMAEMQAWHWPGNVRELRNVVERALVLGDGPVLRLPAPLAPPSAEGDGVRRASPAALAAGEPAGAASAVAAGVPLADAVRDLKVAMIRTALERSGGNRTTAAERLGMHRQSLTRMIRDLGIADAEG